MARRSAEVADTADKILDLNLGRTMPDGQQFSNAAYIDVGWTLLLPQPVGTIGFAEIAETLSRCRAVSDPHRHVVLENESLWTIAEDELGDGHRWDEVFAANEGRTFDDGRSLTDAATHPTRLGPRSTQLRVTT